MKSKLLASYSCAFLFWGFLIFSSPPCFAQADSVYRVSVILPFEQDETIDKLDTFTNAYSFFNARKIRLPEDVVIALDFYQGLTQALEQKTDTLKIELHVYDNHSSDSMTREILKDVALKTSDVIIGSVSSSSAKLVAEYSKQHHIVNIQPFSPSKSLTLENPYHIKLAPTLDAHVDAMYKSICDSFKGANVIVLTPDVEKSTTVAERFDSLFRKYNATTLQKINCILLNSKDMLFNGKKTTVREQLKKGKANVLIITSFDESYINGNLRVMMENLKTDSIVVYGLPTWLNGDVLRLDYLNSFHARVTDVFSPDSSRAQNILFAMHHRERFGLEPTRYSYLGYDVMNFLLYNFKYNGRNFLPSLDGQHYEGAAYQFDLYRNMKDADTLQFYESKTVHVLEIENYALRKVY